MSGKAWGLRESNLLGEALFPGAQSIKGDAGCKPLSTPSLPESKVSSAFSSEPCKLSNSIHNWLTALLVAAAACT